jgi:tripartite-type tricarboxylate transporter receptor subunit TctC
MTTTGALSLPWPRRRALATTALVGAGCLGVGAPDAASAQPGWLPEREVRIVNGFAPGGSGDALCRLMAEALRPMFRQTVLVETRTGANGFLAAEAAARAAPDGHTVAMATMGMLTISPQLPGLRLPIAVETELTPIAALAGIPVALLAYPGAPFRDAPELIAYARAHPDGVAYASAGVGSSPHLAAALFAHLAGVRMVHVPYRGGAPAMLDLAAGRVQVMIGNLPEFLAAVQAGGVRAVAHGGDRAPSVLPGLPLISRFLPGYDASNWFSFVGPARLPPEVLAAWDVALRQALDEPTVRRRMAEQGMEPLDDTRERFAARIAADRRRWAEVIRTADIRAA